MIPVNTITGFTSGMIKKQSVSRSADDMSVDFDLHWLQENISRFSGSIAKKS